MRFAEFKTKPNKFIDLGNKWISEMAEESANEQHIVFENKDNDALNEYRSFVSKFKTDPNELSVGEEYYAVSLLSRPMVRSIKIEKTDYPVTYLGISGDSFVFNGKNTEFQIPVDYDSESEFGPFLITTIVYTTPTECNHLMTFLNLQFSGRWEITQSDLRV